MDAFPAISRVLALRAGIVQCGAVSAPGAGRVLLDATSDAYSRRGAFSNTLDESSGVSVKDPGSLPRRQSDCDSVTAVAVAAHSTESPQLSTTMTSIAGCSTLRAVCSHRISCISGSSHTGGISADNYARPSEYPAGLPLDQARGKSPDAPLRLNIRVRAHVARLLATHGARAALEAASVVYNDHIETAQQGRVS